MIAGADDFVAIAHFANTKKDWFEKFLDMSSGVPPHDRFNSILKHIKPDEFERRLLARLIKLHAITHGQVIAIDGKTLLCIGRTVRFGSTRPLGNRKQSSLAIGCHLR